MFCSPFTLFAQLSSTLLHVSFFQIVTLFLGNEEKLTCEHEVEV